MEIIFVLAILVMAVVDIATAVAMIWIMRETRNLLVLDVIDREHALENRVDAQGKNFAALQETVTVQGKRIKALEGDVFDVKDAVLEMGRDFVTRKECLELHGQSKPV